MTDEPFWRGPGAKEREKDLIAKILAQSEFERKKYQKNSAHIEDMP